jgi:hypothetical protein
VRAARRHACSVDELLQLLGHFLFKSHFCLIRRSKVKDHSEVLIGYARRGFSLSFGCFTCTCNVVLL